MGLYDEIRWDAALPPDHPPESRLFQTKSFDSPCLDRYVVTAAGRLLLVGNGFGEDAGFTDAAVSQTVDVEFHGDVRLISSDGHREYRARFTHGTLEWIHPLSDGEPSTTMAAAHLKFRRSLDDPR